MADRFDGKLLDKTLGDGLALYVIPLAARGYRLVLHETGGGNSYWDYEEYLTVQDQFDTWDPLTVPSPSGWYRASVQRKEQDASKDERK